MSQTSTKIFNTITNILTILVGFFGIGLGFYIIYCLGDFFMPATAEGQIKALQQLRDNGTISQ